MSWASSKTKNTVGTPCVKKTVTIDFFTHKSVKNNGIEPQYFVEGHHIPHHRENDWLLAQQIRKERRYRKRRSTHRKPRIVVKGVLSGFMIVDPSWDEEYVDNLLISATQKPEPAPAVAEEDEKLYCN